MGLLLVTAPAENPVSLAEAKLAARVDITKDDAFITALVSAATGTVENDTHRQLVTATWKLTINCFPHAHWQGGDHTLHHEHRLDNENRHIVGDKIKIPKPRLRLVNRIDYIDTAGLSVQLPTTVFDLDTAVEPGIVFLKVDQEFPDTQFQRNVVAIEFEAGFGAAVDVPDGLKQAIKLLVVHWYEHRTPVSFQGQAPKEIALTYDALIGPFVIPEVA